MRRIVKGLLHIEKDEMSNKNEEVLLAVTNQSKTVLGNVTY